MCDVEDCQRPPGHEVWFKGVTRRLCCFHYVIEGGAPASWHPACLKAYEQWKGLAPGSFAKEVAEREAGIRSLPNFPR